MRRRKVSSSDPQATLEEEDFPHGFKLVVLMVARPNRCFYINLPMGRVTIFAIAFLFKMPKSTEPKPREIPLTLGQNVAQFDPWYFICSAFPSPRGTLVFTPAIVSLTIGWIQIRVGKWPYHRTLCHLRCLHRRVQRVLRVMYIIDSDTLQGYGNKIMPLSRLGFS
ncbi:hypothetical protein B0H14DRAFT_644792 [Mycena olivaceomarginata]|nr:hypothetical protein B0H14DRAFT_644792 [Mycena olivaceomarginata]